MLCGISGKPPEEPVVNKKTGTVYDKRLIEKYIGENNKDPINGDELDHEDLLPLKTARLVRPRPPTLTSIPALLSTFQNEWDALALETFKIKQELSQTRQELATALYQHDAAIRVIARLTRERDEARTALSQVTVSASGAAGGNNGGMEVDQEILPEQYSATVDEVHQRLSKGRKKRSVPAEWVTPDEVSSFTAGSQEPTQVSDTTSLAVDAGLATVAGLSGVAAQFDLAAAKIKSSLQVGEAVSDTLVTGKHAVFATTKGTVKVFRAGKVEASLAEHAGAVTGLAVHPGGELLASVGADKSFVFYNLNTLEKVARTFTDSSLTTCAFHPDGHLLAAGTSSGDIKIYMTKTSELAASFSLDAPVQAVTFSENGYWIAATAKGQTTVTIFDLRKDGDAAVAKVLDVGATVSSLAWDYTGQFLATAGPSGVTVQQYAKGSKKWSEPLRHGSPAVAIRWGENAKTLIAANREGVLTTLASKDA